MKLFKFNQYIKESLEFTIEDIVELFQDFKDNYYIIDIQEIYEKTKNSSTNTFFPGQYIPHYVLKIRPESNKENEISEDLSDKFINVVSQIKAWGFSVASLTKVVGLSKIVNFNLIKFDNGIIHHNDGDKINCVELLIMDEDRVEELTIDMWFNSIPEVDPIKLEFDYKNGSIGFSNFNMDDVISMLSYILGRDQEDVSLLDFTNGYYDYDEENSISIPWSLLDNSKDDYQYEIYDLVSDYYDDFEWLIKNSTRLKSDRSMSIDEVIVYLEDNYPDLVNEIFDYLLDTRKNIITKGSSIYLQMILKDILKVDVINTGVRIYFPNVDFINYGYSSYFADIFETQIIRNKDRKDWKSFLKGNINKLANINNKINPLDFFDFDFTYSDNDEIVKIIHSYEN